MNLFKGLVKCIFIAGCCVTGCTHPQPDLQMYTGRYERAVKAQTNYVDVAARNGELIVNASWDKYDKPLGYLNGDNFMVKGFGWAIKFTRGYNKQVNGFIMTGDALWHKVNRDSSIYQLKKWQLFTDSARLHIYPVPTARLQFVTGKYGDKRVSIQGGYLFLVTPDGSKVRLYPISSDMFVTDEYTLKFIPAGNTDSAKIDIRYKNGYLETLSRVK